MDNPIGSPSPSAAFHIRAAQPADVPALMRLKQHLAEAEDSLQAVRASAVDWLRDGFGPQAGFSAYVAQVDGTVVGMATCSRHIITGWDGPIVFLQDLFVEPAHRRRGIGAALMARVAALAREIGSPVVELMVRADNAAARTFYRRTGFQHLSQCLTYALAGPALEALARGDPTNDEALALTG